MKNNILDKIRDYKINEVKERKINFPQNDIIDLIKDDKKTLGFRDNLIEKNGKGFPGIIAEVKKASPSKGIIKQNFNHIDIAKDYETGNAACISVLTDFPSFQGKLEFLKDIRDNVNLPLLRKDFMIDPYQVYEAKLYGADCILIIMKMVEQDKANEIYKTAKKINMDVFFEINNESELNNTLDLEPKIIGIKSNSNLMAIPNPAVQLVPNIPIIVVQNNAKAIVINDWQLANDPDLMSLKNPLNLNISWNLNEYEWLPNK